MPAPVWTTKEDAALRRLYSSAPWFVIEAALPGRGRLPTMKRAFKLGVKRGSREYTAECKGGLHEIANIMPACAPCNFSKHDMTYEEWKRKLHQEV